MLVVFRLSDGIQTVDTELFLYFFWTIYSKPFTIVYEPIPFLTVILDMIGMSTSFLFAAWQHLGCILGLPVYLSIIYSIHRKSYPLFLRLNDLKELSADSLYTSFSEIISGSAYLHTFQWEDYHWQRTRRVIDESQAVEHSILAQRKVVEVLRDLLVAIAAIAGTALAVCSGMSSCEAGMLLYEISCLDDPLNGLLNSGKNVDHCVNILQRSQELIEQLHHTGTQAQTVPPEHWPRQGVIEFRNVRICPE